MQIQKTTESYRLLKEYIIIQCDEWIFNISMLKLYFQIQKFTVDSKDDTYCFHAPKHAPIRVYHQPHLLAH